jgi:hypothetical protein
MELTYRKVSSSLVSEIAYDKEREVLGVRFVSGAEYHHFGVPERVYPNLVNAPSIGAMLNREIKGAHEFRRVR